MAKTRGQKVQNLVISARPLDGSAVTMTRSRSAMSSAWEGERILDGFASIGRVEAELSKAQDDPKDRPQQFQKARHHFKHHWFIRAIVLIRYSFFHFGFRIAAEKDARDGSDGKVRKWEKSNRKMYRRYAREAWLEWLIQDNVVGVWRQQGGKPPLVYPPENCEFEDLFGQEILKLRHNVTQDKIDIIGGFSRAELKEFVKVTNELKLTHDNKVFGFDVLRRERVGNGFGVPTIAPLFVDAAGTTSLQVGDAQRAAAARNVYEQHKMGHEIKSGIHAGSKAHFWNETRAKAFETAVKGKTGHIRITTNFDHDVEYPGPDPKLFDAKRYAGPIERMAQWAMPLGQMILGKNLNPFLMNIFKYQAMAERDYMAEHLRTVFVEAFGAPEEIVCQWGNRCFTDPRISADLMKTGLAAGPLSQGSFLDEAGFNQEEEWEKKEVEGGKPKKLTNPIYDAAHGPATKGTPGRKAGTRDGEGD